MNDPTDIQRIFVDRNPHAYAGSIDDEKVHAIIAMTEQSSETHARNYKYDGSYECIDQLIRRFCPAWRIECEKLFVRVLFCYAFGNGEAHLKNFSLFTSPDGDPVLTPVYDLVNSTLHLPHQTPLALRLFADDHETPQFQVLGCYPAADFLILAERLGVMRSRAARHLDRFIQPQIAAMVEDLIARSFIDDATRAGYRCVVEDRRRALAQGR